MLWTRGSDLQDQYGNLVTNHHATVAAALRGRATKALIKAMRRAGIGPALGQEIYLTVIYPDGQRGTRTLERA